MMEDMKRMAKFYLPYVLLVGGIFTLAMMVSGFTTQPQHKMYDQKWEKFDQQLYRYSIYDGWLVRYGSMGMTFVPDAAHQWKLEAER